jgi:hypothetical protein
MYTPTANTKFYQRPLRGFETEVYGRSNIHIDVKKGKVKQSLYTPWRRLGGEEI